jgi:hypothetical protein
MGLGVLWVQRSSGWASFLEVIVLGGALLRKVGYPVGEIALDDGEEGFLKGNL